MRKRALIICFFLAAVSIARAQVSMTLQVPPAGVLVKPQLWNMLLVNASSYSLIVEVNLVIIDEKNNQTVLTASTMPISLPRGAKQLQAKDLGAIQYNVDPAYRTDGNPNGLLPIGTFQACYSVVSAGKEAPLAQTCIQVNVDPLSPPLLNSPADSGQVYTPYPQFTWLPPTPPAMFSDLSYTLVLVSVLPGQSSGDALQENVPVYSGGFIRNLYLNYPSSYPALDTSKIYAWRIVALNAGQPAGMSDIWTFKYVRNIPGLKAANGDSYMSLKREQDPSIASSGDLLKLAYENMALDTTVTFTVTSIQDKGNPVVQQGTVRLRYGQNFLQIPLTGGYAQSKVYLFQLVNRRNEKWNIKFTYIPTSVTPVTF